MSLVEEAVKGPQLHPAPLTWEDEIYLIAIKAWQRASCQEEADQDWPEAEVWGRASCL